MSFIAAREPLAIGVNLYRLGIKALGFGLWVSASRQMIQVSWGRLA